MNNDIRPMTAEQATKFLKRVYDDLSAADAFVGITAEEVFEEKVRDSLRALLLHVGEEMPKLRGYSSLMGLCEVEQAVGYDKAVSDCKRVIEKMIEEIQ